jgi:hypothetical protein
VSFLYVIAGPDRSPVKLGFSAQPEKRVRQLQTGSSIVLSLYHIEKVDASRVKIAEKALHRLLGYKRLSGEWFDLTVEEAIAEVEHIRITEGSEPFRYEVPKP